MEYSKAEEVKTRLIDLIEEYRNDLKGVKIEPVFRYSMIINKTKEEWARIHKVSGLYKFLLGIDFILEICVDVWDSSSEERKKALVAHELKHIKVDYDSKGERVLNLIPHDFEEFEEIIQKYGFWKADLKRLKEIVEEKKKDFNKFRKKQV